MLFFLAINKINFFWQHSIYLRTFLASSMKGQCCHSAAASAKRAALRWYRGRGGLRADAEGRRETGCWRWGRWRAASRSTLSSRLARSSFRRAASVPHASRTAGRRGARRSGRVRSTCLGRSGLILERWGARSTRSVSTRGPQAVGLHTQISNV